MIGPTHRNSSSYASLGTWQSLRRPNAAVLHKVSHAMQSYSAPVLSSLTEFGLSCHSIFLQSCPRSLCHSVKDSNHGIHPIRDERAGPPSMLSKIPKFGVSGSFVSFSSFSIFHFSFLVCKRAGDKPQGVLLNQRCHEPILECI